LFLILATPPIACRKHSALLAGDPAGMAQLPKKIDIVLENRIV